MFIFKLAVVIGVGYVLGMLLSDAADQVEKKANEPKTEKTNNK